MSQTPSQFAPQQGEDNESQDQKDQYNPLASPPNLTLALRHGNATRIGKMDMAETDLKKMEFCECCGLTLNHRPVPVCGSRLDLHDLGAGFPLYFEYLFFGGILLFVMFLIVGIWGLISSYKSIQCDLFANDATYPCRGGFIIEYSMGNKGPADEYRINSILNLVFVVVGILMAFYYRRVQAMTADEVDRGAVTNSDYTIMVSGIPKSENEDQIKEFFKKKGKYGKQETMVKKVNLAYEIGPFVELVRKRDALAARIAKGDASEKLKQQLEGLEEKIKAFEEAIDNKTSNKFTGIAFITFNTEKDTMEVVRKFQMSTFQKTLYNSLRYFLSCIGVTLEKTYNGHIIKLGKAPDPLDVFWENLGHDWWKVMRTRVFSLLSTVILIGMSFGIILGISFGQQSAKKNNADNGTLIGFLAFLGSYVIVIINGLIGFFMRKLAGLEKHTTYTYYFISIANKLTYAQFFNTALITLFVQLVRSEGIQLWVQDSIVSKVFFLFLLNAFVPSLTYIFNPGYLWKLFQRSRMISQGAQCKLTQAEANKLFEGPQVDIAQRYANVQKTLLFTAFYANLVPIGIVFSFVGLFITYWTDKWVLLRRHTRPQVLGKELAEEMTDFLELFFVAFASGNLIFEKIARDEVSALNIVAAALAVAAFLLPQQLLSGCIRKAEGEVQNGEEYDQARFRFVTEYDRVNPVTKGDATEEWKMEISKMSDSQGEKGPAQNLAALFQHMPKQNASSSLTSYAQYNPSFQQVHQMNNGNFNMAFAPRPQQPMMFAPVQYRPQGPTPVHVVPQNRILAFPPQMARFANQQFNKFVPIQMQNAFGFNQPRPVVANHFPQQNPQPIAIQMAQVKPPVATHFPQPQPPMQPQMQQQPPMNPPPVANRYPQLQPPTQQQPPMNPPPVANHFPQPQAQPQPQMQQQPPMMNQPQPVMAQPQPIMVRPQPQPQPQQFAPMMPMGQPSMMQQQPPTNIRMVQQVQPTPFAQPQGQFGFQQPQPQPQPQPQFGFQQPQPQPQFGMQQPNMQMNYNNQQPRVGNTVFGGQPGFGFRNQGF